MTIKTGTRLTCAVSDAQFIVIRDTSSAIEITCGGVPLVGATERVPEDRRAVDDGPGSVIGKRYQDADGTLELLCTKSGHGTLRANGTALRLKAAKNLPSSD